MPYETEEVLHLTVDSIVTNNSKDLNALSLRQMYVLYSISSLLYYQYDKSMMSDSKFDHICKLLLDNYDPEIIHVSKEDLKAGTGFSIKHGTTSHNICQTMMRLGVV